MQGLALLSEPIVRMVPPRSGQKEKRYVQLLSGEPLAEAATEPDPRPAAAAGPTRVEALETEVAALKADLAGLREEFARFRKQFE